MGLLDDLGVSGIPKIDITGFLSSSWIWVFIAVALGFLLIVVVAIVLFITTYNKKVEFYENISGRGYQRIAASRARIIKIGMGGEEVMKTLMGGIFLTAHGHKMGRNLYWFAKGSDGYWYNCVLGDLDTAQNILDIEPIERDVRFFQVALDRLSNATYNKSKFLEKYAVHLLLFVFLLVLILGMWFIVGKVGEAVAPLSQSAETAARVQEANSLITSRLDSLLRSMEAVNKTFGSTSGLVAAPT